MKLITYITHESQRPRLGAIVNDVIVNIETACSWAQGAASISHEDLPDSLLELIYAGPAKWDYVRRVLAEVARAGDPTQLKGARHQVVGIAPSDVHLLAPIRPVSLRDGYAFEQHVKTANANRGREVPEEWYQFPVFYYSNPHSAYGPEDIVPYPRYTKELDYELEIAVVIGQPGFNVTAEEAEKYIFGFTIFNDWSARDIQRAEMKVGLGPAKGKDFASSFGPCIITLDELTDRATGRPGVYDLAMSARINGVERSRGNFKDMHWSFGDIIARASDEAPIYPGDIIGSGTLGTGCLLELTKAQGPWLNHGDVVELEIEKIGVLRNKIA
jgi:fumarylacetoacetate (FAA) hydrolase